MKKRYKDERGYTAGQVKFLDTLFDTENRHLLNDEHMEEWDIWVNKGMPGIELAHTVEYLEDGELKQKDFFDYGEAVNFSRGKTYRIFRGVKREDDRMSPDFPLPPEEKVNKLNRSIENIKNILINESKSHLHEIAQEELLRYTNELEVILGK